MLSCRILPVFLCIYAISILCIQGCAEPETEPEVLLFRNYTPSRILDPIDSLSAYAVIEIPAGTSVLQAMDTSGAISPVHGQRVDFLPFPGNYGFIAGCGKMDTLSGIPEPLPVLIIMDALAAESVIAIRPVATLVLRKEDQPHPVVIAVPADTTLRSARLESFADLITDYDATRNILQQWFLNYLGREAFGLSGWKDEHYTRQLIRDWKITQ